MHCRAEHLEVGLVADLVEAGWTDSNAPELGLRQRTMSSLANSFMKKFHNEETDELRDSRTLQLFLEHNERCRGYDGVNPRRLNEELVIGEMKSIIYDFFNPIYRTDSSTFREPHLLNLGDIASCFGLGNGSNIGADKTDFYSKYVVSKMSSTNEVLPLLFRQAISVDKLWSDVEAYRAGRFGYDVALGNRLSFVPKSRSISRTICTEPLLNMFFQKGIGGILERRLKEVFSIDLSKQPDFNSALARIGSVHGEFGTIDLSSASDSISLRLIEDLIPIEPRNWLLRTRSPVTILPDGKALCLHMISSMGNGYTFPLQTMIFAALVFAAYRIYGIKLHRPRGPSHVVVTSKGVKELRYPFGNYGVFGDDIIVDRRVYNVVVSCLEVLGFSVNKDKSFNEGLFRESCGHDFYCGYDIRGVYLKTLLDANDHYSAINRLNRWSATHGIQLSRTVKLLRSGCRFIGVPFDEADDAGIKVPLSLLRSVRRNANGAIHYLASVSVPLKLRIPSVESDAAIPLLGDGLIYVPDGVMLCLLAGWLRAGFLALRVNRKKVVLRRRVCPGWDERIAASGVSQKFNIRWKAFVEANLVS